VPDRSASAPACLLLPVARDVVRPFVPYDPRMKVGVVLPMNESDAPGASAWPRIRTLARHAEAGGIDSLWVYDHLVFRFPDEPEDGIHEAWTLLSALAAATERAELGTIVLATSFRAPALLAKMAATADEIAGGRLILGLGCGWHEPEYRAFGFPFDSRVGRFEEALQVIGPLVRGERVTLHGRWTRVEDAVLIPPPPRGTRLPGRMPILVAAKGERMLRLTARHADAWNTAWFGLPDERFATRLTDLRTACEAEGRDPATLELTVGLVAQAVNGDDGERVPHAIELETDALAAAFDAWVSLGIGHVQLDLRPITEQTIDVLLEAVGKHRGA
jgi:probable F420-dependent oxidoreductase